MGAVLGVPIKRIIEFGGPLWGPLILGMYHICASGICRVSIRDIQ